MTKREEAVYVAYTSVIEGNQAGFSLEVQPGGAAAGPREGCLLTCLQLPAQPDFFLNPEPSARGRYHPVGWTLRLQPFIKKLLLPWSASRPFDGGILLPEGRPDSSACVKSIKKTKTVTATHLRDAVAVQPALTCQTSSLFTLS